jgi:hypothetical protein
MDSFTFAGDGGNPAFARVRVIDGGGYGEVHEYRDTRNNQVMTYLFDLLNYSTLRGK